MSRPIINIQEAEKSPFPVKARYSDNAAAILKLANQKATIESKGVVGTEDILWATFASSQTTSRSKAVEKVRCIIARNLTSLVSSHPRPILTR